MIRAFIALHPPEPIILAFARRQRRLQKALPESGLRWTNPQQNHLTLRFLGDIDESTVSDLAQALERACQPHAPFTLRLGLPGCFPGTRRPRVLWVGLAGDLDPLMELQRSVVKETGAWGELEERPFHPHLTLARVRHPSDRLSLALEEALSHGDDAKEPIVEWPVSQVDLMRSELLPQGSRYTRLARVTLTGC